MTVQELIRNYKTNYPEGHYFDPDTMKFFGERLSEMSVLKSKEKVFDYNGDEHLCFVLNCIQRPPYGKPFRKYHYFDVESFDPIIPYSKEDLQ